MKTFDIPEPSYADSFDGTRLALYEMGNPKGPVLFLVNGLGGNLGAWKYIIEYYQETFRILSYDYRGMYRSGTPPTGDFTMAAHTADALFAMDHFQVDQALVMGWSMGVQIVLELYRQAPERVRGLILANGAYGRPLDAQFPGAKAIARGVMGLLGRYGDAIRPLARPVVRTTLPLKAAKAVGFVSRHLDEEVFRKLAREFAELDFANYKECVDALLDHDAEDVLETIQVPTLILGGGRDLFTPRVFSETMARRIPNARLALVPDASHYAAVEYPGFIISHMERFLLDELPTA